MAEGNDNLLSSHITEKDLAGQIGVSTRTLRGWRQKGEGPAWCRIGIKLYYAKDAVAAWLRHIETVPVRRRA